MLLACVALGACSGSERSLSVDLLTDFVAEAEFESIEVSVLGSGTTTALQQTTSVGTELDYTDGVRVARFEDPPGEARLKVRLLRDSMVVGEQELQVRVGDEPTGVRAIITRNCIGVVCPGAGDSAEATTCLGGACVEQACFADRDQCPADVRCTSDSDCGEARGECADARCVDSVCLLSGRSGACEASEYCVPELGCAPRPSEQPVDAGLDGAQVDASDMMPDGGSMDAPVVPDADPGVDADSSVAEWAMWVSTRGRARR